MFDIEKIIIKYSSGAEREIYKGAVINLKEDKNECMLDMEFLRVSGEDFYHIVNKCLKLQR